MPSEGLTVYRLARSDPPTIRDFEPLSADLAERRGWPELHRTGLSHFLRPEQSYRIRRSPLSRVVAVRLPASAGIYVARTGRTPGHVTVWARPDALLRSAFVVH